MRLRTRMPRSARPVVIGLALAAAGLGTAVPVTAAHATAAPEADSYAGYAGSQEEAEADEAFFEAVIRSVAEKRAAAPGAAAVTVVYDASRAPAFASRIARSTRSGTARCRT